MKTRFCDQAGEGAHSNYSTERSPRTALLREASRTVLLPVVRLDADLPPAESLSEAAHKVVECSFREP